MEERASETEQQEEKDSKVAADLAIRNSELEERISEILDQCAGLRNQVLELEAEALTRDALLREKENELLLISEKELPDFTSINQLKEETEASKDLLAKRDQQLKELLEQFAMLKTKYEQTSATAKTLKNEQGQLISELKEKQ